MRPYRPSRIVVERDARLDPLALRVIDFYAGFETDEAMHRFNAIIDAYREGPG